MDRSVTWNKISDNLPKALEPVLLWFPDCYWATGLNVATGFWSEESNDWFAGEADSASMTAFGSRPTHWAELPGRPHD